MKSFLSILAVILTAIIQASAADKDIADYFRALPNQKFTEGSPSYLLDLISQPGGLGNSFIDSRNGFIFLDGGPLIDLQIALFRYANQRPLLAIAWGNYFEDSFTHLSFYTESYGEMVPVGRAILPFRDSANLRFELPPDWHDAGLPRCSGKIPSQWTWNREQFVEH
jgi:hypothetical protein